MIKKLILHNFQSHKHTELILNKGVNIIKGQSHSGKSSIIRALRWVLQNQPRGDNFKSHFAGKKEPVYVEIDINGNTVQRIKDGKNSYFLNKERYDALEQNIPDVVTKALNISPINIQSQSDVFFLLNDSPAKIAKYIGSIIGIGIITDCINKVSSLLRDINWKITHNKEQLEKKTKQFEELSWIEEAEIKIKKLQKIEIKINDIKRKLEHLEELKTNFNKNKKQKKKFRKILSFEKDISTLLNLTEKEQKIKEQLCTLNGYKIKIKELLNKKEQYDKDIKTLETKYNSLLKKYGVCPLCKKKI